MLSEPSSDYPSMLGVPGQAAEFIVTIEADLWDTGDLTPYEVAFAWDGDASHANFVWDISREADLSPGSSSPAPGWLSWIAGPKLAVAFEHTELEGAAAANLDVPELDTSDMTTVAPWAAMAAAITRLVSKTM